MVFWRRKTYEELPALSVRGPDLRKSLRLVTMGWMFGIIWMTCVTGARFNLFARMVGFNDFHFGLWAAVPFIATFMQLWATILIERTGLRKYQFIWMASIHRLVWLLIAAIPLLSLLPFLPALPSPWAVWALLLLQAVSCFVEALGRPAWFSWMGDLIPRRIRGRYFAMRSLATEAIRLPVVIFLAIYLTAITPRSVEAGLVTKQTDPVLFWSLAVIFAAAAISGTVDILLFLKIREVVPEPPHPPGGGGPALEVPRPEKFTAIATVVFLARGVGIVVRRLLMEPLRDSVFRRYVVYGATMTFAMVVSGQFFFRHVMESLRFEPIGTDLLFMVLGPLVGMATSKPWGRLMDRWGRRPVLMFGSMLTCLSVMPYFFASRYTPNPGFVVNAMAAVVSWAGGLFGAEWHLPAGMPVGAWLVMSLSMIFGGAGWRAVMMGQTGIVLSFADGQGRSKYIAAHSVLISIGGVLGGLIGGFVAYMYDVRLGLHDHPIRFGVFEWNNWHATFFLSLLARIAGVLLLVNMVDPGAGRARDMFREVWTNVYGNVSNRLFYPLRIFGWSPPDRPADDEPAAGDDTDPAEGTPLE